MLAAMEFKPPDRAKAPPTTCAVEKSPEVRAQDAERVKLELAKTGRDTSAAWQCDRFNREIPRFQREEPSILGQNRRLAASFHGTGIGPLALRALGALWGPAKSEYVQMQLASNLRDRQGHLDPDTAIFFGVGMMAPGLFSRVGLTQAPEAVPPGIVKAVSGKPVVGAKAADAVEVMPVSAAPGDLVYLRTDSSYWDHLTDVFRGIDDHGRLVFGMLPLPPRSVLSATKIGPGDRIRVEVLLDGGSRKVVEGTIKDVVLRPNATMLDGQLLVLERVKTPSGSILDTFEFNTANIRNLTLL